MAKTISKSYLSKQFSNFDKEVLKPRFLNKIDIKQDSKDKGKSFIVDENGNVILKDISSEMNNKIEEEIEKVNTTIENNISETNEKFNSEIEKVNESIKSNISAIDTKIETNITTVNEETDSKIATVNETIELEISTINEKIKTEIATVNDKINSDISNVNDKISNTYTKEEVINAIVNKVSELIANSDEDFDTLQEMSAWLSEHKNSAAEMNKEIFDLKDSVDKNTNKFNTELEKKADSDDVPTKVTDLEDADDYAKNADVGDLSELSTTDKSSVVAAINETNVNLGELGVALDGKADKTDLNEFRWSQKGNSSTGSADCNDFHNSTKTTYYYAFNPKNCIATYGWMFFETIPFRDPGYAIQFCRGMQADIIAYRRLNEGTWAPWTELATMDKVVKYPDWSDQQAINQTEITLNQDVYIELNQLSTSPTENLKINGKNVSTSDFSDGLYSTRFSGYVKKGSVVSHPYLTYPNLVRVFPLV